jgi:hypothetical protein
MIEITYQEGLELALKYGMEYEYNNAIEDGDTPFQALMECDSY